MKLRTVTVLTVVVSVVWVVSFVVRLMNPEMTFGPTLDTAMLLVLGYWFSASALNSGRKNGSHHGA